MVHSLVLFALILFFPSEFSCAIGEMGKIITLSQSITAFTLQILCVVEIVTIMVWWVPRHGPDLFSNLLILVRLNALLCYQGSGKQQ